MTDDQRDRRLTIEISGLAVIVVAVTVALALYVRWPAPEPNVSLTGRTAPGDDVSGAAPARARPSGDGRSSLPPPAVRLGTVPLCKDLYRAQREAPAGLEGGGGPTKDDQTCVIDGDTITWQGWKVRLWGIDTPEIGRAECPSERKRGEDAAAALARLMSGNFVSTVPSRADARPDDYDNFGRRLARVLVRTSPDAAPIDASQWLLEQGLAVEWAGRGHDWCAPAGLVGGGDQEKVRPAGGPAPETSSPGAERPVSDPDREAKPQ